MSTARPRPRRRLFARALTLTAALAVVASGTLVAAPAQAAALKNPVAPKKAPAKIEVANPYVPQVSCDPKAKPGVTAFYNQMIATYRTGRSLGIVQSCSVVNTPGGVSEHKEGRAVDWGLRVTTAKEKKVADQFLAWAIAKGPDGKPAYNARRLGIMYMIYNKRIWGVYNNSGWRPYSGASPHTDHIHVSFAWNGAMKRTSWWTGKAAAVDYGPCKPAAGKWAPKYTKANPRPCAAAKAAAKPKARKATAFSIAKSGTYPVTVTGTLTNKATKKGLGGGAVTLRVKWQGTTKWVNVKSLKTASNGKASYKITSTKPGYYQFVYGGSTTYAGSSTSAPLLKAVPPKVPGAFAIATSGTNPVTVTGTLTNKTTKKPVASAPVTFRVKWPGTSTWVNVASLKTGSTGKVSFNVTSTRPGYYQFVYGGSATVASVGTATPLVAAVVPPPPTTPKPPTPPTPPTPTTPKPPVAPSGFFYHYVAAGQSVASLADTYAVHRTELRFLNGLDLVGEPKAGTWLLVPTKETHDSWHH